MDDLDSRHELARIAGDIVVAYLNKQPIDRNDLPNLVHEVRAAVAGEYLATPPSPQLASATSAEESPRPSDQKPQSAVDVEDSITPDGIICLEDGLRYRSLKRHLRHQHDLTPDAYRIKWGLPPDYPMVAPDLAKARSDRARETGFGQGKRRPRPSSAQKKKQRGPAA